MQQVNGRYLPEAVSYGNLGIENPEKVKIILSQVDDDKPINRCKRRFRNGALSVTLKARKAFCGNDAHREIKALPFFQDIFLIQVFLYILICYNQIRYKGGSHGQNFNWQGENGKLYSLK